MKNRPKTEHHSSHVRLQFLFILSGLMIFAASPPFGAGAAAFFSLIPFLYATERAPGYRTSLLGGMLAGCALFVPGVYWMTNVSAAAYVALALYCASYLAVFGLLAYAARRTGALWQAALLASGWVVLEILRGHLITGFPWLLLSHTQYDFVLFGQVVDVIGAYGLGGVIVALNALIYRALSARRRGPAMLAAGIFCAVCLYGYVRIHSIEVRPIARVALVQASVPQEMKELLEGKYDPKGVLERYIRVSDSIPTTENVDMIVWPETVLLFPFTLNVKPEVFTGENAAGARFAQDQLSFLARKHNAYILAGATSYLPAEYGYVQDPKLALQIPPGAWNKRFNSAYLFGRDGHYKERYDKIHLVPFGEYLPLENVFPFFAKLVPFTEFLLPGEKQTIFHINDAAGRHAAFGVLICYEDMDPELARGLRQQGADFFVNISNDAWFATSIELDQHFAVARFRAMEHRVGIVRSGNNGITGVIDPLGRVQALFAKESNGQVLQKDVTGHLVGEVSTANTFSLYTHTGDIPVLLISIALLAWFGFRRDALLET